MKATELMIGDWVDVYCENPDESGFYRPGQIRGINGDEICFGDNSDCPWFPLYEPDTIEPIPLTPEILEKNGFEIDKNFKNSNYKKNVYILAGCVKWKDNVVFVDITSEVEGSVLFLASCKYVHQFQHLLKDLEIEKEIIL